MRLAHKQEVIKSLEIAQKITFSPLTFQAIGAMLEFGILKSIDTESATKNELIERLNISEYTANTLLDVAEAVGLVKKTDDKFAITQLGQNFLYDEMTRINFNYVKEVCYLGANELIDSFKNSKPEGLRKLYPNSETIYPHISELPPKMRKSWYEFDHYYSDNCFNIIYKMLENSTKIFDIGGNTGKFERLCLKNNPNIDITMIDLEENIKVIAEDEELKGCKFHATNVLDENSPLPKMSGAIFMSQFLDCFSKEQIVFILKRLAKEASADTKIYILEPFIDKQRFDGAKYSLVHTSLYFTCMANGNSKMYSYLDMEKLINEAGLEVSAIYDSIGAYDYTLVECKIKKA